MKADQAKNSEHVSSRDLSAAARELGRRPRSGPKKWTGYVDPKDKRTRLWCGQKIILPDGQVAYVYGSRRGQVAWTFDSGRLIGFGIDDEWRWGVFLVQQIQVWKDPAAVLLGQSKAGVKERPSKRKREACRRNGSQPCKRGRRGRPPHIV